VETRSTLEVEGAKLNAEAATPTALVGAGEVAAMCVGARERVDGYGARVQMQSLLGLVWAARSNDPLPLLPPRLRLHHDPLPAPRSGRRCI
jgi:hypothetical protein